MRVEAPKSLAPEVIREAARIAETNKLLGELASALAFWAIKPPMDVMAGVAQYRAKARRKADLAYNSLAKINRAFSSAGIAWVAYKGQVLQSQLGRDLAHRPASDVDILVHKADFDAGIAALVNAGCTLPQEFKTAWWRNWLGENALMPADLPGLAIDLHHKVQQPGCPQPKSMDRWLVECDQVILRDLRIPTLSRVNAALLGAINVVKALAHRETAGSHALDLMMMLDVADDALNARLADEADRQGLARTLELAKLAVAELVEAGTRPPAVASPHKADLPAIMLTPDTADHTSLRGRDLLWALTDGPPVVRAGRFVRDSLDVIRAEGSRRRHERQFAH
jgi:hypothetical protein